MKEKAKELVGTYRYALSIPNAPLGDYKDSVAKQCAFITVREMIEEAKDYCDKNYRKDRMIYLYDVEQEIEKL